MPIESVVPKSEKEWLKLRTQDITSTEVSALFGISPYITEFELWHRKKKGQIVDFTESERMVWGTRLQDAIANGVAKDEGFKIRKMKEYIRIPELRMGSSFDFSIEGPEPGILEVKNVDSLIFKEGWVVEDGNLEAPPHIEIQVQHQLAVSCRQFAKIAAFVGGNRVVILDRTPDLGIIQSIKDRVKRFWADIDANDEPKPDFEADAKFISKLYGYAEPGKVLNAVGDSKLYELAVTHQSYGADIKEMTAKRDALKAQMLTMIGDAEKVTADGFSITAGLVGPAHIEYDREGYRNFRVNWPRKKKNEG